MKTNRAECDVVAQRVKRSIMVGLGGLVLGVGTVIITNLALTWSSLRFPEDLRRLIFWTTTGAVLSMSWTRARLTFVARSSARGSNSFARGLNLLRWWPGLVLLGWWCAAWGAVISTHWATRTGAIMIGLLLLVLGHAAIELALKERGDGVEGEEGMRSTRGA